MPGFLGYQLTENLNGSISLQYTPASPGIHRINIECNGDTVEGTPLWCVVQRADYGYITSYGPKLLDILGQPGFAETLDQERLLITTDGENIHIAKDNNQLEADESTINADTQIMEVDQSTTDDITSVLQIIPEITESGSAEPLDSVALDQLAEGTVLSIPDDLTQSEQLMLNEELSGTDIGTAGLTAIPQTAETPQKTETAQEESVSEQVKQEPECAINDIVSAETTAPEIEKNTNAIIGQEVELVRTERKDMFKCPFKGCPKLYGKMIYAKSCELDHHQTKKRGRKPKPRPSNIEQSRVVEVQIASGEESHIASEVSMEADQQTESDAIPVQDGCEAHETDNCNEEPCATVEFEANAIQHSVSDPISGQDTDLAVLNPETSSEEPDKVIEQESGRDEEHDDTVTLEQRHDDTDNIEHSEVESISAKSGRKHERETPVRVASTGISEGRKSKDRTDSGTVLKSSGREKRKASPSPEITMIKRSKRTPKPTWKALDMDLSKVKKEKKEAEEEDSDVDYTPKCDKVKVEELQTSTVRKRGRPPKIQESKTDISSTPKSTRLEKDEELESSTVKKRGRPPKVQLMKSDVSLTPKLIITEAEDKSPVKRRGRPPKSQESTPEATTSISTGTEEDNEATPVKRRGRPPKSREAKSGDSTPASINIKIEEPENSTVRKRGRPPKLHKHSEEATPKPGKGSAEALDTSVVRKRGRPPKFRLDGNDSISSAIRKSRSDDSARTPARDEHNSGQSLQPVRKRYRAPNGTSASGFKCRFEGCQRTFNSASARCKHVRRNHYGEKIDRNYYERVRKARLEKLRHQRYERSRALLGAEGSQEVSQLPGKGFGCRIPDCHRVFKTPSARAKHVRRYHLNQKLEEDWIIKKTEQGLRIYVCAYQGCGKSMVSNAGLTKHIRRVHLGETDIADADMVYRCKFIGCNKIFSNPSNLRKHIRSNEHYMDGESDEDGVGPDVEISDDEEDEESPVQAADEEGPGTQSETEQDGQSETKEGSQDQQTKVKLEGVCTVEGCGKLFKKSQHLRRHLDSHVNFPYQCDKEGCKKMFRFEESLSLHKFSYHGMKEENKRFECELCEIKKSFSSWCLLKKHQRVHTLETPYQCQDCLQRFKWQSSLMTHACINKSGEGCALRCKECGKIFNMQSQLKKHKIMHTESRPFKCEHCHKAFKMNETLKKHHIKVHFTDLEKRIYAEKRGWVCPDCDRVCMSSRDFDRHRTKHSDMRPYICDQCASQFKTQDSLNAHIKQMHAVTFVQKEDGTIEEVRTLNYFVCDFPDCDKKFRRHHMFLEHKKIHYSNECFPCGYMSCKKTYPTIFKLKEHQRCVHKERPPVYCEVCGKRVKNTSSLANHMKLHTRLSRISCDYPGCDKTFTAKTTLDRHVLMKHQSPAKMFQCKHENCTKNFKLKCLLDQHQLCHITERNFHCSYCTNSFKTFNTLKSHEKTHDKSNQYECRLCGKFFPRKQRYFEHLARQHEGEITLIPANENIAIEDIKRIEQVDEDGKHVQYLKPEIVHTISGVINDTPDVQMNPLTVAEAIAETARVEAEAEAANQEIIYQVEAEGNPGIIYQVEGDDRHEVIYQVEGDGTQEIIYQLEGEDKPEIIYQVEGEETKPEIIYQMEGEAKPEIIYQDGQIIAEVKPEMVYQDSVLMPESQIIEFTTNYQNDQ